MIDDGIEIEYPPQYKWDEEITKNPNFVQKINNSNVGMMHESLGRLVKKSSKRKLTEESEKKYLEQKEGNVKFF
tara:strand:+ start:151 stop:372 length:222 start_codon:yes stop_codon:yes gene_type:complete